MSMCSSLELVNVGKRVFFSDIINFKMLRPWVDPKSNDKCPYERDTEERPKRRESRMQKKAQTGAKNPVQGIPLASRRGHEWIRISLKPLEGVLPTPWFWTSSFVNCSHLLTGLLSPASASSSPPPPIPAARGAVLEQSSEYDMSASKMYSDSYYPDDKV